MRPGATADERVPDRMVGVRDHRRQPYEEFTIELDEILGSGDRLVSTHRFLATARHTGIRTELRYAYVWTFRDGKVIHLRSFREREQALEAAGLRT